MAARKFHIATDLNNTPSGLIPLSDPQSVNGTVASTQSIAINGTAVRIVATTGPIYFRIGSNPTSSATLGHYLADQQDIYQPCSNGDLVAIYGGIAQIATLGQ